MNKFLKQVGVSTLMMLAVCGSKVAFAGERGGNGGDAVVCPDRVLLLDEYEARQRAWKTSLEGSSVREMTYSILSRLAKIEPVRAQMFKESIDEMLTDIELGSEITPQHKTIAFVDDELFDLKDSEEIILPTGCEIKQLVIQKDILFPGDKKFVVQKQIWDRMNNEQKALTVMHETWYTFFINRLSENSKGVRLMNSYFAQKNSGEIGLSAYYGMLKKALLISKGNPGFTYYTPCLKGFIQGENLTLLDGQSSCEMKDRLSENLVKVDKIKQTPEGTPVKYYGRMVFEKISLPGSVISAPALISEPNIKACDVVLDENENLVNMSNCTVIFTIGTRLQKMTIYDLELSGQVNGELSLIGKINFRELDLSNVVIRKYEDERVEQRCDVKADSSLFIHSLDCGIQENLYAHPHGEQYAFGLMKYVIKENKLQSGIKSFITRQCSRHLRQKRRGRPMDAQSGCYNWGREYDRLKLENTFVF